jgi:hypothetical protein
MFFRLSFHCFLFVICFGLPDVALALKRLDQITVWEQWNDFKEQSTEFCGQEIGTLPWCDKPYVVKWRQMVLYVWNILQDAASSHLRLCVRISKLTDFLFAVY